MSFLFEEGREVETGDHGQHDFTLAEDIPVTDEGASAFVFEEGTGLGSQFRCITVTPPIDIAITCDNYYDLYVNSTANKVGETSSGGSDQWRSVEEYTGISLNEGENILGVRGDNESGDSKDFNWDSGPSPGWGLIAIRDADGNVFIPDPDSWHHTVDGIYQDTNPYGADWVDPSFNADDWDFVTPCSATATNNSQHDWSTSEFFGSDPHFSRNGSGSSCPGTDAEHGVWFERWCIIV